MEVGERGRREDKKKETTVQELFVFFLGYIPCRTSTVQKVFLLRMGLDAGLPPCPDPFTRGRARIWRDAIGDVRHVSRSQRRYVGTIAATSCASLLLLSRKGGTPEKKKKKMTMDNKKKQQTHLVNRHSHPLNKPLQRL